MRIGDTSTFLYASSFELERPGARRLFEEVAAAFRLREVARARVGADVFRLFRVERRA